MEFLESMILVSEKAANIARAVREESHLLSLLVQEKKEGEKNPRFAHDFKTLADVLVQEVVKHDLGEKFPDLVGHIHGEESNEFTSSSGDIFYLRVGTTMNETKELLIKVLNDEIAADVLANTVHSPVSRKDLPDSSLILPNNIPDIPLENTSIWIDPIDSTGEYISAENKKSDGVFTAGLPCVTVLIGTFLRDSGIPVAGVINQPFYYCDNNEISSKHGHIVWGVNYGSSLISSVHPSKTSSKIVVISASENEFIRNCLTESGFNLIEAAGAGYKLLCVIEGIADAYVLSKGTTFFWDTCSCDSILRSLGGGVLDYTKVIQGSDVEDSKLKYSDHGSLCNSGGIIAYVDRNICDIIIKALSDIS
ncbi:inositol polyphosphate 1-phosphatase [Lycorma delicatula]|uniref:inositol polyphosphate 1-phosphatase n=1 Tax=Lycorma delicatula TaxID=130591 RepID=UPI003F515631